MSVRCQHYMHIKILKMYGMIPKINHLQNEVVYFFYILNVMSSYIVVEDWVDETFTKLIEGCYSTDKITATLYEIKRILNLKTDSYYSLENVEALILRENSELSKYFIADIRVYTESNDAICRLWKDSFVKCETMCKKVIDEGTDSINKIHKASSYLRDSLPRIGRDVDVEYKFARCGNGTFPSLDTSCLQTVNTCSSLLSNNDDIEKEVKAQLSVIGERLIHEEVCITTSNRIIEEERNAFIERIKSKTLSMCEDIRSQTILFCRAKHFPMKELSSELKKKSQHELHEVRRKYFDSDLSGIEKLLARYKINNDVAVLKETLNSILSIIDKCINIESEDKKKINRKPWFAHVKISAFDNPFDYIIDPSIACKTSEECENLGYATLKNTHSSRLLDGKSDQTSYLSGSMSSGHKSCKQADVSVKTDRIRGNSSRCSSNSQTTNKSKGTSVARPVNNIFDKTYEKTSEVSRCKTNLGNIEFTIVNDGGVPKKEDSIFSRESDKISERESNNRSDRSDGSDSDKRSDRLHDNDKQSGDIDSDKRSDRFEDRESDKRSDLSEDIESDKGSYRSDDIKSDKRSDGPDISGKKSDKESVVSDNKSDVSKVSTAKNSSRDRISAIKPNFTIPDDAYTTASLKVIRSGDEPEPEINDNTDNREYESDPESDTSKSTGWQKVLTKLKNEDSSSDSETEVTPHPSWAHWMKA